MPHGQYVERRAELEVFGMGRQMSAKQGQVGDALVAFSLEVMLGSPQAVVARIVHLLGQGHSVVEGLDQLIVGVASVVWIAAIGANIFEVYLADV